MGNFNLSETLKLVKKRNYLADLFANWSVLLFLLLTLKISLTMVKADRCMLLFILFSLAVLMSADGSSPLPVRSESEAHSWGSGQVNSEQHAAGTVAALLSHYCWRLSRKGAGRRPSLILTSYVARVFFLRFTLGLNGFLRCSNRDERNKPILTKKQLNSTAIENAGRKGRLLMAITSQQQLQRRRRWLLSDA